MRQIRSLMVAAPLALACVLASVPGHSPAAAKSTAAPDISPDDSPYGLFLAGQAAANAGRGDTAAAYFDRAAALDGGDQSGLLETRTFTALLLSGDVTRAAAVAPTKSTDEPMMTRLGALTQAVEALAVHNPKRAYLLLTGTQVGAPTNAMAQLLAPWAAADSGDYRAATVQPVIEGEPVAQFYAKLDQGKIFERFRHYDEAENTFRALISAGDPGGIASLNLGLLLERRGRFADAAAIYEEALAHSPQDQTLKAARTRALARGAAPALPSVRQSAAEALVGPATVLVIQKQEEVALAYLRLALRLDPGNDEAWVLVGDILADMGDQDGARDAYMTPKPGSHEFLVARGKLAWSYQTEGDKDAALRIAKAAHEHSPADQEAATTYADLLRADEKYDDSAKVLGPLIDSQGEHVDWRLLYMRAVDLQANGHWPDAERDLTRAMVEAPDEPELLNFLGYSWIDRGEKLTEALAMVKKAVSLNPQSGATIDSLGWAYYRLGDYKNAVEQLEGAVVLEAGDPEINDHLGDAYWRVGRHIEAQFQWRRVLTLEPTEKLKASVEAKLKSGLDAAAGANTSGS
jgi:Flp pilus assembly protein TadD